MPDMQKLRDNKEQILSIIRSRGPNYPARISREAGLSPLFTSAFLAELVSEKRLKISNMKVGSSPLYFLEGQETELEKFSEHLNPKERDALHLLKSSNILQDETLPPPIRVALRSLKDFALPINVRISGESQETKLFWRYFSLSTEKTKPLIQDVLTKKENPVSSQTPKPAQLISNKQEQKTSKKIESQTKTRLQKIINESQVASDLQRDKRLKPQKSRQQTEFGNSIREYLSAKDIEVLKEISEKKREFISSIRIDTLFGKQSYYLIAKDKKRISTNDLTIALQISREHKMPALILSPGELDKKAQEHLKEWNNLIKFEQVKT